MSQRQNPTRCLPYSTHHQTRQPLRTSIRKFQPYAKVPDGRIHNSSWYGIVTNAMEPLLVRVMTDNAMSADNGHDGHWDHGQYTIPHGRPRSFPGDRGWPDTWPTHGSMPCKSCHPVAPVLPRATSVDQQPDRPLAPCAVNSVAQSARTSPGDLSRPAHGPQRASNT